MSEPNSKFARRYDREFKENAVALVLKGRSQGEVSRDLGVSAWSLGEWVKQAKAGHALEPSENPRGRERTRAVSCVGFAPRSSTCASSVTS